MAGKVIVNDNVVDKVFATGVSVNEALAEIYNGEIQDKIKDNALFGKMTPMQIALYDAGITKKSTISDMVMTTQGGNEWLFPAFVETRLAEINAMDNNILRYLVKSETTVNTMVTQSAYLDMTDPENQKNAKLARVAQGSDLPLATIRLGENAIQLHKYGRAVEQTYEAAMTMRVDLFSKNIDMIANDVTNQKVEEAARVALVGDGNNNAAQKLMATTAKDTVSAEELGKALLDYYIMTGMVATTIIAGKELYASMYKMLYPTDQAAGASIKAILNTPQVPTQNINLILARNDLKVGAKNVALILNDEFSLTKHTLAGSMIREMSQNIRNQTKLGTISEITGFSKNLPDGVMYIESAT